MGEDGKIIICLGEDYFVRTSVRKFSKIKTVVPWQFSSRVLADKYQSVVFTQ